MTTSAKSISGLIDVVVTIDGQVGARFVTAVAIGENALAQIVSPG